MLKAGVHPKIVSERLGHASVALTLDTYSHIAAGLQEAAARRFDQMLETPTSEVGLQGDVSKPLANAPGPDSDGAIPQATAISLKGRG